MFENQFETETTEFEFNSFHRMPSKNHGKLQTRIARLLDVAYDKDFDILTAVDLELPTGKAIPDIAVFPKMKIDWDNDEIRMTNPPITAIEILSPRQALTDLTDKNNKIYFPAGVKSTWIIMSAVKMILIIASNGKVSSYSSGPFKDPATGIESSVEDIFAL